MAEKRVPGRKKKRLKVRFGVDYLKRVAFTRDASAQGLHVITSQPERPGTKVMLEIQLPDNSRVLASGVVRWARRVHPNS